MATIQSRDDRQFAYGQPEADAGSELLSSLDSLGRVELEPAPDAAVCGAGGCRETAQLIHGVIKGFGRRVLCADHRANLIRREVFDR